MAAVSFKATFGCLRSFEFYKTKNFTCFVKSMKTIFIVLSFF